MSRLKAIALASDILGSKAELARAIQVDPATVTKWFKGKREPTPQQASEIERMTGGQIKREWIRPAIFG